MNAFRKWIGFLNGLMLVMLTITATGFAVPASAAVDKQFSLSVKADPHYAPQDDALIPGSEITAPVKVIATFTNLSPPSTASSNVGSLTLSMTVPGMSIVNGFIGTTDYSPKGTSGNVIRTSATSITVTNMAPLKGQQEYKLTLYVSSCGDTTWTGTANTGSQLNGSAFKLKTAAGDPSLVTLVSCGTPDCVNTQPFSVVDTTILSTSAYLMGVQGAFNKDGACTPVNYFVSNMLSLNGQLHFRWPVTGTGAQPTAAFSYEITLPVSPTPKVGWLNYPDGSPATSSNGTDTPVYIDPLRCDSDHLPAPIATLDTSISKTATQMKVSVVGTVPPLNFDVVIGTERMRVTSIQGGGPWRITRGVGGTNAAPHSAGAFVMSTPLPLFAATPVSTLANGTDVTSTSPYHAGDQAQVCKTGDTMDNGNGTFTTPFIDIGDAYVRGSF